VEERLLECLDELRKAGDDLQRRKKVMQRSSSFKGLSKEWKALAMVAAAKEEAERPDSESNKVGPSRGRRVGRRGGRGKVLGLEDAMASPRSIIDDKSLPVGYKLAVLIIQRNRMGDSWSDGYESEMDLIRESCETGVHPVWERMARESPLLAELGLFPVQEKDEVSGDQGTWLEGSKIDYEDQDGLRNWLKLEVPFALSLSQRDVLNRIRKDLIGKPRFDKWEEWMSNSLSGLDNEQALLEGVLLAAAGSERAESVLKNVGGDAKKVASEMCMLMSLRDGNDVDWESAVRGNGNNPLSLSIKIEGWLRDDLYPDKMELDEIIEGVAIVEEARRAIPDKLAWIASEALIEKGDYGAALKYIEGRVVTDYRGLDVCLKLILYDTGNISLNSIISGIGNFDEECLRLSLNHQNSPPKVRLEASKLLKKIDQMRYTDEIVSSFTMSAEIKGLTDFLIEEESLQRAYPFRVMMAWHLITARDSVGISSEMYEARRVALESIEDAEKDEVLSNVSIGLISLLDGISSNLDAVHDKLDSDGLRSLNEVRMALGPEGDGIVKEVRIEKLVSSVEGADLTVLERRLFEAVINALILNRAAINLQNGDSNRREEAISSLEEIISFDTVSMRTIRFASDLVFEHSVGLESLDNWYRENDRNSAEYQIVKAALLERSGDLIGSAWSYKEAAMKLMEDDIEKAAIFLRWSLISFAHGGGWKEAVSLIDAYPTLSASVTNRFKMYLRACKDYAENNQVGATSRIIDHATIELRGEHEDPGGVSILDILESIKLYPIEHGLPLNPFQGRVLAAIRKKSHSSQTRRSDLEDRFDSEMRSKEKDTYAIVTVIEQVAESSPIRALRMFERALVSGEFGEKDNKILRSNQRNLFTRQSGKISVRERKTLRGLGLKPLILVDTNILIDALKDDLLREISQDSLGSLGWTMQRAFHWKLRTLAKEGRILLHIPKAAMNEFMNRVRSTDSALGLFENVYIDRKAWNDSISNDVLEERVSSILSVFDNWEQGDWKEDKAVDLESFLTEHRDIFRVVDQHKREHNTEITSRTEIDGEAIYPEDGDCEIMKSGARIAESFTSGVGSVVVATRDSDFKLVSRALEEEFGFGVVGDVQQLNKLAYLGQ